MCETRYCKHCDKDRALHLYIDSRPNQCMVCRAYAHYVARHPKSHQTMEEWEPGYIERHNRLLEIPVLAAQGLKRCAPSCCGQVKPYAAFNKNSRAKDGHHDRCRECAKAAVNKADRKRRARERKAREGPKRLVASLKM